MCGINFLADLVAFTEVNKLPTHLIPFVKIPKDDKNLNNIYVAIFKIRGTIDSYHTIIVEKGMTLKQITERIKDELKVVKLSIATEKKLIDLLEKFNSNGFVHFIEDEK